jgi:hypothetical protein
VSLAAFGLQRFCIQHSIVHIVSNTARKHQQGGDNLVRRQKRKAGAESFEDVKRLREDTRNLSNQFAGPAVQLTKMMLLIQQLEENASQNEIVSKRL